MIVSGVKKITGYITLLYLDIMGKKKYRKGEQSKTQPNFVKRKRMWGFGLLAATTALGSALWFSHPNNPTFEEACADPNKRAAYVEAVERKFRLNELPYVEDIKYSSEARFDSKRGQAGMEVLDANVHSIGKGRKFVVQVYDGAFDSSFAANEMEFVSSLIDHEVEGHAKPQSSGYPNFQLQDLELAHMCQVMTYEGSKEQILSVDEIVLELYAYRNQLRKAAQRGMNDHHNRVMGDYIYWFSVLVNPQVQNSLDKETLKRFLSDFFIPEFAQHDVEMRGYRGPLILHDGKMATYFGVIDLPDYLKEKVDLWVKEGR